MATAGVPSCPAHQAARAIVRALEVVEWLAVGGGEHSGGVEGGADGHLEHEGQLHGAEVPGAGLGAGFALGQVQDDVDDGVRGEAQQADGRHHKAPNIHFELCKPL